MVTVEHQVGRETEGRVSAVAPTVADYAFRRRYLDLFPGVLVPARDGQRANDNTPSRRGEGMRLPRAGGQRVPGRRREIGTRRAPKPMATGVRMGLCQKAPTARGLVCSRGFRAARDSGER